VDPCRNNANYSRNDLKTYSHGSVSLSLRPQIHISGAP